MQELFRVLGVKDERSVSPLPPGDHRCHDNRTLEMVQVKENYAGSSEKFDHYYTPELKKTVCAYVSYKRPLMTSNRQRRCTARTTSG